MSASPGLEAVAAATSHVERTAAEPREPSRHAVVLSQVQQVNERIRVLQLAVPQGRPTIQFLPGQWLDVYVPGVPKPGGFTITSTPSDADPRRVKGGTDAYLELAVQDSPRNPPAAWLWRPAPEIIGQVLHVRVGGSFVWPPPGVDVSRLKRIAFVASGVGINPLISIVSHLAQVPNLPYEIFFLYSVRDPAGPRGLSSILFWERLAGLFAAGTVRGELILHLTAGGRGTGFPGPSWPETASSSPRVRKRRITREDLWEALGPVAERRDTVCYICGVPAMTDELVAVAQSAQGMDPKKVLFERWW